MLLCGYRNTDPNEETLGLNLDSNGMTLIDYRISQLEARGHDIVCVLSGNSADEQLRCCPKIANTELVFDTNEDAYSLISNTRAGAFATEREAIFVLPLEVTPPAQSAWKFLLYELARIGYATPYSLLQAVTAQGAPCHFGFPLLLTREGSSLLRENADMTSLVDKRLKYLHLEPQYDGVLEQPVKPL